MQEREKLVENLIFFIPTIFKKLMKSIPPMDIPKQQFGLLHAVCIREGKTMSCYSEKMQLPKSNISVLADRLIKGGYLIRDTDPEDRRVINLRTTQKGKDLFSTQKNRMKHEMAKSLEDLQEEDILRLNTLIIEMRSILDKLE
ncbi:MarR family transcriptional regulator [Alkalibaculum bacchi]|uniref:MarR family transcriptional regulator n=1 Tax=Alkalibaculum bacchi TaxID=645887 RepID=A0A366IBA8_9FIRM|nr:MarR family transcriptional regulator [Alkalibaculum bacchi]RBP66720.1 MarR family transcriptional regulator [Alkalibaculum bacchi]